MGEQRIGLTSIRLGEMNNYRDKQSSIRSIGVRLVIGLSSALHSVAGIAYSYSCIFVLGTASKCV